MTAHVAAGDATDVLLDERPARTDDPHESIDAIGIARRLVDSRLDVFFADRHLDVPEAPGAIDILRSAIRTMHDAGGKRLRPAFVVWGHVAAGGELDAGVVDAAAATELLHDFALLHDDVMDRSMMRRGLPAAHVTLRAEHPSGDDHWFGISAAVLAGDLAFVWADQLLDGLDSIGLAAGRARRARAVFTTMRTEVIAGQFLDLQLGTVPAATEDDVARIALLKSARYTVTRPLQIGATLAGADDDLCDRLAEYGDAVGIAFQLRDDVLGLFGEPERTGKSCADDLREGKRNLLTLCALRRTGASGRRVLIAALGAPDVDQATVDRCREVVAASGALSEVEAVIGAQLDRALALSGTFDERATAALRQLARDAARRES